MGKVLIIDDEKQILGLLSRIIGLEGYEVLQAATCKAGHSAEAVLVLAGKREVTDEF